MESSEAFGFFLSVHFHTPEMTAWRAIHPTRKIPNTDHAEHALTETSIIAARTLVLTLAILSSSSTADQASIQLGDVADMYDGTLALRVDLVRGRLSLGTITTINDNRAALGDEPRHDLFADPRSS